MLSHHTRSNSPSKGSPIGVRLDPPTDDGPAVLKLTPSAPTVGPIYAFTRLVDALHERDQAAADEARRELRRRGFNVIPIGGIPKKGRAAR